MKCKSKLHILYAYQPNTYLTVDSVVKLSEKCTQSPISQFAISKQLHLFKIIELNRVSIFFHEIFRINVELNFDLKFSSGIFSKAFKKFVGQILKFAGHFSEFGRQFF